MSTKRSRVDRRRGRAVAAAAAVVVLAATACGTRLTGDELALARGQSAPSAALPPATTGGAAASGLPPDSSGPGGSGGATVGGEAADDAASSAPAPGTSLTGGGAAATTGGTRGSGGTVAGAVARSALVLGSVGTFSGPAGAAWLPGLHALRLWVAYVNGRGGLDGHPVRLVDVDDGGDPARHFSAVKELVEDRGVFAFLYNTVATTESSAVLKYLQDKGVPVIGTDLSTQANMSHPYFFPQGTASLDQIYAHVAGVVQLRPALQRFGQVTCREAPGCNDAARLWWQHAKALGLETVYRGEVSIAQPDFTAECLSAQNDRVQIFAVAVDPNSMRRLAMSCARQGFRPTYLLPGGVVASTQDGDDNFEGAVGVTSTAPWMVRTGAGPAALHAARGRYSPRLALNLTSTFGWASGMLLEAGARRGLGTPPSRARLVGQLYQLRGESLGGISPPLTFERGRPKRVRCWFALEFQGGRWTAAAEGRHVCP